ncbi:PepSY domain-containing protein [Devosia sp. LjRoot3]|uniref:PepSY domain-containing protein n=1 Tax=Devosia sp. LjRoot3 TaxID=3342319 RepID=UPI003ECEBB3A
MRVFVLILTVLCLSASPVLAQNNGQGNGNGQGNANGQENGNGGGNNGSGNGLGQNSGNGNGNDKNDSSGNGNAANSGNNGNGQSNSTATDKSARTDDYGTLHHSQDYARDLVNAGRAVSLASLMPDLQARSEGSVIDAELLNVQGILVYSVKVLRTDGRVTREYYYAQSGRFIGSER